MLAKHSKSFSLIDCVSVGVDRMQRNFEPMRKQIEAWQRSELTDVTAKVVIYEASWRVNWRLPSILRSQYTPCISNRSTTISGRGRSGAFRMRSHRLSRNWNQFHSLRRRQNRESFSKRSSRSRFDHKRRFRPDAFGSFLVHWQPLRGQTTKRGHRRCVVVSESNHLVRLASLV